MAGDNQSPEVGAFMSAGPKVSVLTPSYNYAQYIGDCISSIAEQQTNCEFEHIVQDGRSTDGTEAVVAKLNAPTVRWLSEPDSGQSDALNRALSRSSGELIGWLNADEFYLPGAIQAAADMSALHPNAVGFYGDCAFVDADGRFLRLVPAHRMSQFALRQYGCFISSCTTFIRREPLVEAGWDVNLRRSMDWDLWLRLSARGELVYIPRVLAAFRVHSGQVTNVPESHDRAEFEALEAKNHFRRSRLSRRLGALSHAAYKQLDGAYRRQRHAHSIASGEPLTWWDPEGSGHAAFRLENLR